MTELHQFSQVDFRRFKAFKAFRFDVKHFNILVGPNNAGKSTILAAFRILAAAMRRAIAQKATLVSGPVGIQYGYNIDLRTISVAEENIFYNYETTDAAEVTFRLANGNILTLYFPAPEVCLLLPDAQGKSYSTPAAFRKQFNCSIGFVPILGPVEHHEDLYQKEAARLALFSYTAARNFRNIWHHYPEKFDEFRTMPSQTWPGMDIQRPEIDRSHLKPRLHMYCPEQRIPRELFWSGFGFQVWCQMLTHLIQSSEVSLFLIDEPDIYLHSELQRQLLALLRNLGPDILIATHSTEIITEAETDDIVLVNKNRKSARRIKDPSQLQEVFGILGSSMNPILTQLAKTRRVLFVEGKDFQILGKFARKLDSIRVGNRSDFAVVPIDGFNPERARSLKAGMEATLGAKVLAAAILDRDYRCIGECEAIRRDCEDFCEYVTIHSRKEVENFLLVPEAIDRTAAQKINERVRRTRIARTYKPEAAKILFEHSEDRKNYVTSQILNERGRFERLRSPGLHPTQVDEMALDELESVWRNPLARLDLISGKEALSAFNRFLQDSYGVSITSTSIIDAMRVHEIPTEIVALVERLAEFSQAPSHS